MSLLSDREIQELCIKQSNDDVPMIQPYMENQVREVFGSITKPINNVMSTIPTNPRKVISYGPVPFGYDVTLSVKFKLFTNINSIVIDPKQLDERCLVDAELKTDSDGARYVILPPNSYILGCTREHFVIPDDITVLLVAKSTYARSGIQLNTTLFHAGFEGEVVLEIANSTNLPVKIYADEGIGTCLFFRGNESASQLYQGHYQQQQGVTLPNV